MNILNYIVILLVMLKSIAFSYDFSYQELINYSQELEKHPTYIYPYPDLQDALTSEGKSTLPLFVYGSLLDKKSAARTLSAPTIKTGQPALAFGIKRVFNRDISLNSTSSFGPPCTANARGMLNVEKTEHIQNFINGVLLEVPIADLSALREREIGYDLVPVIVADWNSLNRGVIRYSIAYTFLAPPDSVYVNPSILPRPGYYELTRDAIKQYGPLYEILWYHNTFMADGKTPVIIWEHNLHTKEAQICETKK